MQKRLRLYNKFIVALLLVVSSVCSLLIVPVAHATSPFDNVVDKTGTLKISGANSTCMRDITTTWSNLLHQASVGGTQFPYQHQAYLTAAYNQLLANQTTGSGWGLWQVDYQGRHSVQLVIFPSDTQFSFEYAADGVTPILSGYHTMTDENLYFVEMSMYNCDPVKYTVKGESWLAVSESPDHISYQNYNNPTYSNYAYETKIFAVAADNITYPTGYVGEQVPASNTWADVDEDGLTGVQEATQDTSDYAEDTDGDGLDDNTESIWYPSRDALFCKSGTNDCAYPTPTLKDLYVEIDWVNKVSRDYVPSSYQISKVVDTFSDQGILAHFDTGQLGGGERVYPLDNPLIFAPTENKVDFYDLKNGTSTISAEFNTLRRGIWHYMISGPNFMNADNEAGTTGAAFPGDDDSMISIEAIEDMNPSDIDAAIASTILHELGHNLCLTQERSVHYPLQAEECVYGEIDKPLDQNPSLDYGSVMNYRFQLSRMDYSHGVNGVHSDHDDWQAVMMGMNDFQDSLYEWSDTQDQHRNFRNDSNQLSRQSMIDDIQ